MPKSGIKLHKPRCKIVPRYKNGGGCYREVKNRMGTKKIEIIYVRENLPLFYAITIHKSQGSEFDVVIIPLVMQHFTMLYRNLIYTALTRAKKMAIFVGTRKALSIAVKKH